MAGSVRFLIPEGGVSALDKPGQPFHYPEADQALFNAIVSRFEESPTQKLIRTPYQINDAAFTKAVVDTLEEINPSPRTIQHATF